eukprot:CAMPEP_0176072900 /NCGR_PEP_ID=MMETSP0120_2-20121206/36423_1 /TAXON_ID=160619 /ORGANISM="Kryptoperidinium foliaceum, Strain CCMP 1326" /LENGTH=112 /DNA_ID=CAMNT_0017406579 /DNA_START=23 /DNA_END=357 /DNA_ORIENTATION=-
MYPDPGFSFAAMTKQASWGPKLVANMPAPHGHHVGFNVFLPLATRIKFTQAVKRLLLAWVGDLGHGRHLPVGRRAQAARGAVPDRENLSVAPELPVLRRDLHVLVEDDPAAA